MKIVALIFITLAFSFNINTAYADACTAKKAEDIWLKYRDLMIQLPVIQIWAFEYECSSGQACFQIQTDTEENLKIVQTVFPKQIDGCEVVFSSGDLVEKTIMSSNR